MADHRAEQIMLAVMTKLTGLATTGARVYRGRVYPLDQEDQAPGLLVYSEGEDALSKTYPHVDMLLQIVIEARFADVSASIESLAWKIAKEVTIALTANHTQGLDFVFDTVEGGKQISLSGEGDAPSGLMRMEWAVHYRRAWNDPSA